MDSESRKMFRFGIFILIILLFAVSFFIWGIVSKGTLSLMGDAPFEAKIFDGESVQCERSPCEIRLNTGTKSLFVNKAGHKSLFIEPQIKLWSTTEVNLSFQLLPELREVETLPEITALQTYEINDEGGQKLIKTDDPSKSAIVYFPKKLNAPKVFGGGDHVLILDKNVYKVNTKAKTRQELKLEGLTDIVDGKWSASGKYFLFNRVDSPNLWLIDTGAEAVSKLALLNGPELAQWFYDDTLVFVTDQDYSTAGGLDGFGNASTEFLESYSEGAYTVGFYYPEEKAYSRFESFSDIVQAPDKLIPMANGESIYLKIGDKNFRIILRKF